MEKSKQNYLVWVLVICLALAAGGFYYLGNYFASCDVCVNENKEDVTEEVAEEDKLSEEEINELGKELFARTDFNYGQQYYYFYGESVTYEQLTNTRRLEAVLNEIDDDYKVFYSNSQMCNEVGHYECLALSVSKQAFEDKYHEIFGSDKAIHYEEFTDFINYCRLEDNSIHCYNTSGGDVQSCVVGVQYYSAELIDDTMYVFAKALGHDHEKVYADVGNSCSFTDYIADDVDIWNTEEERLVDNLFTKYGEQAGMYMLIFKKDTNNNWYWTKTEKDEKWEIEKPA